MLAENYRYLDEVELLKRLHDDGRFGDLYYGAGEYLHDCRDLWYDDRWQPDLARTWSPRRLLHPQPGTAPLRHRGSGCVRQRPGGAGRQVRPDCPNPTMHLMQMVTTGGVTLRVRVDHVSPRPHQMAYYALQGTAGCVESWRGGGDQSKAWFADEHEPSTVSSGAGSGTPCPTRPPATSLTASPPRRKPSSAATAPANTGCSATSSRRSAAKSPPQSTPTAPSTTPSPALLAITSAEANGAPQSVPDPRAFGSAT